MSTGNEMFTPEQFAIWVAGVLDAAGDAPSPEVWALLRAKTREQVAELMRERLRLASVYDTAKALAAGKVRPGVPHEWLAKISSV